jgi:hypothetical protein
MEVKNEVKTIRVDFLCPKCEKGFLRPTGNVLTTYPAQYPPQYPHKCNNPDCDYVQTFGNVYPYVIHEPINLLTLLGKKYG